MSQATRLKRSSCGTGDSIRAPAASDLIDPNSADGVNQLGRLTCAGISRKWRRRLERLDAVRSARRRNSA